MRKLTQQEKREFLIDSQQRRPGKKKFLTPAQWLKKKLKSEENELVAA